jgi:hypothetical protein
MTGNDFEFFRIFNELFDNAGAPPLPVTPATQAFPVSMTLVKSAITLSLLKARNDPIMITNFVSLVGIGNECIAVVDDIPVPVRQ